MLGCGKYRTCRVHSILSCSMRSFWFEHPVDTLDSETLCLKTQFSSHPGLFLTSIRHAISRLLRRFGGSLAGRLIHVLNDDRFEPDERLSYRTTPRYMVVRTERKSGMGSVSVYDVLST